jgi:hypothetical protein
MCETDQEREIAVRDRAVAGYEYSGEVFGLRRGERGHVAAVDVFAVDEWAVDEWAGAGLCRFRKRSDEK